MPPVQSQQYNTSVMYENCQALPTKTPERRQDNVQESVSGISKVHREETIAFHEEREYKFLISNSGKPS